MFLILIVNQGVYATTSETTITPTLNEILATEEKIMKYDTRTNETTEVNMEELRQVVTLKNNMAGVANNSLSAYEPSTRLSLLKRELVSVLLGT